MINELDNNDKLRAAIVNVERENLYLYFLEIDYESKEIIICITEKILWSLVPINPELFLDLQQQYYGYEIFELPEKMARFHGDRNTLLSKN